MITEFVLLCLVLLWGAFSFVAGLVLYRALGAVIGSVRDLAWAVRVRLRMARIERAVRREAAAIGLEAALERVSAQLFHKSR